VFLANHYDIMLVQLNSFQQYLFRSASWDAVVTCFFLDTAHNIVEYIEIISKILKDGGVSYLSNLLELF